MSARLARRRAEQLIESLGVVTLPIDVIEVARRLGARVVEALVPDDVSGMLVRNGATVIISVKPSDAPTRKRFTIAHEIGHLYLEHQFKSGQHVHVDRGSYVSHRGRRASEGTDPMEVEANQFASALLMPSALLKQRAAAQGDVLGEEEVDALAQEFAVSVQAMTIRLGTLGLL